ncbi:GAF domain-containing protein [Microlunatus elymi]|uniref:GAF domain-containing protein n=1 Tax=Microlunatus elymi TaxID=2596828 RepID=A0A516PZA8_9ACTN|nr:GAF domain-containing protein [Microlunatus elymi]QDP96498.1 GAF domain-containing protein [Microlunatus elymi]
MTGDGGAVRFPDIAKLELDELIDELVERAQGVRHAQGRLRALLRATESVAGDLSLQLMLRRIAEAAAALVGAEYAALGVIGSDGGLDQFIHVGVSDEDADRIGPLPQGKGLLGALITDPRPIRLNHITDDERSSGFPANHPAMDSFLGVPIHVRDEVFGNLYLTNSRKGAFTEEDEQLVIALASAAGTAISNARLYQEAQLRQRWSEASAEVHAQLLSSTGEDPLHSIARRAIEIADADLVTVGLLSEDRLTFVIEAAFGERAQELLARRFELAPTLTGLVVRTGQPFMAADAADLEYPPVSQQSGVLETGPIIALPLRGTAEPRGVLTLARRRGRRAFTDIETSMAAGFAQQASVALELAQARAAEQKMIILEDRERIARDLHDHVIQQLFAIGLSLDGVASQMQSTDPLAGKVRERVEDLDRAIRRIRTSIFALRGSIGPARQGLRQSILDVAGSVTPILGFSPGVSFAGLLDLGLSDELTEDAVACVRELLTNVGKHAHATDASVDVELLAKRITITVTDNGIGMPAGGRRSGLDNLRERAEQHHGTFELRAGPAGGTVAVWRANLT